MIQPFSPALQKKYRDTLQVAGSPTMVDDQLVPTPVVQVNTPAIMIKASQMGYVDSSVTGTVSQETSVIRSALGLTENQQVRITGVGVITYTTNAALTLQIYLGSIPLTYMSNFTDTQAKAYIHCNVWMGLGDKIAFTSTGGAADDIEIFFSYEVWENVTGANYLELGPG